MLYLWCAVLGVLAGILAGALGIGGGTLIVPALVIIFKQEFQTAVGTSLLVIIAISLSGAIRHLTLENLNFKIAAFIAFGGIIGALIGANLIEAIQPVYAKRILAVILVITAVRLWMDT